MELILNLTWVLLVASAICQWRRAGVRNGTKPWVQVVALTVLVLILFPVVSVTDDLQAALSPAEIDLSVRRDHAFVSPHSIIPAVAEIQHSQLADTSLGIPGAIVTAGFTDPIVDHPALAPIESRPPPVA